MHSIKGPETRACFVHLKNNKEAHFWNRVEQMEEVGEIVTEDGKETIYTKLCAEF